MKLIQIAPKKLHDNPENPRRTPASAEADATLLANVQAVGILQPPIAREVDGKVVLIAGHRRRGLASV
jgi:ParB family chromosome partitioning protein